MLIYPLSHVVIEILVFSHVSNRNEPKDYNQYSYSCKSYLSILMSKCPSKVVENREGSRWTPACVSFKGGGDPVIGTLARAQRFEV